MRFKIALLAFVVMIVSASFTYYAASDCLRAIAVCFGTNSPTPPSEYAPFKYRLAEPFLTRLANPAHTEQGAIIGAVVLFTLLTMVIVPTMYIHLTRYMSSDRAIIGVMVYALVQVGAFHIFFLTLSTAIETCLVVLTLLLVTSKWWVIAPLIVLSSFNRETGVLIGAIYLAYHGRSHLRGGLALVAIWAGITGSLHIVLGAAPHVNSSLLGMLQLNLSNIVDILFCNLFLSPLYYLVWKSYRGATIPFKRLTLVMIVYLVAVCVGANPGEMMRYVLPIAPIALVVMLSNPYRSSVSPAAQPLERE